MPQIEARTARGPFLWGVLTGSALTASLAFLSWLWIRSSGATQGIDPPTTISFEKLAPHRAEEIRGGTDRARVEEVPEKAEPAPKSDTPEVSRAKSSASKARRKSEKLPSLRRCLLDPDLNPDRLDCSNPAVRDELERFIGELNAKAFELREARQALIQDIAKSKIAASLDPPSTWPDVPTEQIEATVSIATWVQGRMVDGATMIRRGERPELDDMTQNISELKLDAREKLKARISELCR